MLVAPVAVSPWYKTGHGLALHLDLPGCSVLLDAGPDYRVLEHNAGQAGIDLGGVTHLVLTSWEKSSIGGVPAVLARARPVVLAPPGPKPRLERHGVPVETVAREVTLCGLVKVRGGARSGLTGRSVLTVEIHTGMGLVAYHGCECPDPPPRVPGALVVIGKNCPGLQWRGGLACLYECGGDGWAGCFLPVGSRLEIPLSPPVPTA